VEASFKAQELKGRTLRQKLDALGLGQREDETLDGLEFDQPDIDADLAWHVRVV
jgi:hypothetical protein